MPHEKPQYPPGCDKLVLSRGPSPKTPLSSSLTRRDFLVGSAATLSIGTLAFPSLNFAKDMTMTTAETDAPSVATPRQFNIDRSYPGRWTVTFSNPPINMFVPATIVELGALMTDLETDPSVKVVVFQSDNPDFFVAHLDVAQAVQQPGVLDLWRDFVLRLSSAHVVSIAKVR